MTFEVGKTYKTGNGETKEVLAIAADGRVLVEDSVKCWAWIYSPEGKHPNGWVEYDLIPQEVAP